MLASIITYTPGAEGAIGNFVWDFSSVLSVATSTISAVIELGVIVALCVYGYKLLRRYVIR